MPIEQPPPSLPGTYVPAYPPRGVTARSDALPSYNAAPSFWARMNGEWRNISYAVQSASWRFGFTTPTLSGAAKPGHGVLLLNDLRGDWSPFNPHRDVDPTPGVEVEIRLGETRSTPLLFNGRSAGIAMQDQGEPQVYVPALTVLSPLGWLEQYGQGYWAKLSGLRNTPADVIRDILEELERGGGLESRVAEDAVLSTTSQFRLYPSEVNNSALLSRGLQRVKPLQALDEVAKVEIGKVYDDAEGKVHYETYWDRDGVAAGARSFAEDLYNPQEVRLADPRAYVVNYIRAAGAADFASGGVTDIAFWHPDPRQARALPMPHTVTLPPGTTQILDFARIKWDEVLQTPVVTELLQKALSAIGADPALVELPPTSFIDSWQEPIVNYRYQWRMIPHDTGLVFEFENPTNGNLTATIQGAGADGKLQGDVLLQTETANNYVRRHSRSIERYGPRTFSMPQKMVRDEDAQRALIDLWAGQWNGIDDGGNTVPPKGLSVLIKRSNRQWRVSDIVRLTWETPYTVHCDQWPFWIEGVEYEWSREGTLDARLHLLDAYRSSSPALLADGEVTGQVGPRWQFATLQLQDPRDLFAEVELPTRNDLFAELILPRPGRREFAYLPLPIERKTRDLFANLPLPYKNLFATLPLRAPEPERVRFAELDLQGGQEQPIPTGTKDLLASLDLPAPPAGFTGSYGNPAITVTISQIGSSRFRVIVSKTSGTAYAHVRLADWPGTAESNRLWRARGRIGGGGGPQDANGWERIITLLGTPPASRAAQIVAALQPSTRYEVVVGTGTGLGPGTGRFIVTTAPSTPTVSGNLSIGVEGTTPDSVNLSVSFDGNPSGQRFYFRYQQTPIGPNDWVPSPSIPAAATARKSIHGLESAEYRAEVSVNQVDWAGVNFTPTGFVPPPPPYWTLHAGLPGQDRVTLRLNATVSVNAYGRYKLLAAPDADYAAFPALTNQAVPVGDSFHELTGLQPGMTYIAQVATNSAFTTNVVSVQFTMAPAGVEVPPEQINDSPWTVTPGVATETTIPVTVSGGSLANLFYMQVRAVGSSGAWTRIRSGIRIRGRVNITIPNLTHSTQYEIQTASDTLFAEGDRNSYGAIVVSTATPEEGTRTPPIVLGQPRRVSTVYNPVTAKSSLVWSTSVVNAGLDGNLPATVYARYQAEGQRLWTSGLALSVQLNAGSETARFSVGSVLEPGTTYKVGVALDQAFSRAYQEAELETAAAPVVDAGREPLDLVRTEILSSGYALVRYRVHFMNARDGDRIYFRALTSDRAVATRLNSIGLSDGQTTFDHFWRHDELDPPPTPNGREVYIFQVATTDQFRLGDDLLEFRVTWPQRGSRPVANTALSDLRLNGVAGLTAMPLIVTVTNPQAGGVVYWGYRRSGRGSYTAAGSSAVSTRLGTASVIIPRLTPGTRYDFVAALSANLQTGRTLLTESTRARISPTLHPVTLETPTAVAGVSRGRGNMRWTVRYSNLSRLSGRRIYARYRLGDGPFISRGSVAVSASRTSGSALFAAADLEPAGQYHFQAALDANFSEGLVEVTESIPALPVSTVSLELVLLGTTSIRVRGRITNWEGKLWTIRLTNVSDPSETAFAHGELLSGTPLHTFQALRPDTTYEIIASVTGGGNPAVDADPLREATAPAYSQGPLTSTRNSVRLDVRPDDTPRQAVIRAAGEVTWQRHRPIASGTSFDVVWTGLVPNTWYVVRFGPTARPSFADRYAIKTKR